MAFNNSIASRLGDLRSRNNPVSTSESPSGYTTPSRYSGSFMNSHSQPSSDARASLQRRFTTDLSKMQPLAPINQQSPQIAEQVEGPVAVSLERPELSISHFHFKRLSALSKWPANICQALHKVQLVSRPTLPSSHSTTPLLHPSPFPPSL